ncbi:hypothetical protein ACA910_004277 [Epithemia clementina (nom. ined.)]
MSFSSVSSLGSGIGDTGRHRLLRKSPPKSGKKQWQVVRRSFFQKYVWLVSFLLVGCFLSCLFVPLLILEGTADPIHYPVAVQGVHQVMNNKETNRAQQLRSSHPWNNHIDDNDKDKDKDKDNTLIAEHRAGNNVGLSTNVVLAAEKAAVVVKAEKDHGLVEASKRMANKITEPLHPHEIPDRIHTSYLVDRSTENTGVSSINKESTGKHDKPADDAQINVESQKEKIHDSVLAGGDSKTSTEKDNDKRRAGNRTPQNNSNTGKTSVRNKTAPPPPSTPLQVHPGNVVVSGEKNTRTIVGNDASGSRSSNVLNHPLPDNDSRPSLRSEAHIENANVVELQPTKKDNNTPSSRSGAERTDNNNNAREKPLAPSSPHLGNEHDTVQASLSSGQYQRDANEGIKTQENLDAGDGENRSGRNSDLSSTNGGHTTRDTINNPQNNKSPPSTPDSLRDTNKSSSEQNQEQANLEIKKGEEERAVRSEEEKQSDDSSDETRPPPPPPPPALASLQVKPHYDLSVLMPFSDDKDDWIHKPVARGVAGRPLAETPAVVRAERAHIANCDMNVDSMAYWNDPVGTRDLNFQSPFVYHSDDTNHQQEEQFITFSPDCGGWNNIRMSMEILFVLAAITNRTLVLPPKQGIYLLNLDKNAQERGFADFFPLTNPKFPVKLMSMEDFLTKNPKQQEYLAHYKANTTYNNILDVAKVCEERKLSVNYCAVVYDYLDEVGHNPKIHDMTTCLIFDIDAYQGRPPSAKAKEIAETYCGADREVVFWSEQDHGRHNHLHLPAYKMEDRLLAHFYNLMYFSDPAVGNYAKRFVRDYLHYHDAIYCAAGKIVKALQAEAIQRGFSLDSEKGGGYSSLHVRRGDLQFKEVWISGEEWYNNTKDAWLDKEILYIATDERNKTFFDELARHHELRFLDDYWDLADLSSLDPNYVGMIDTIVASRGRAFAGTWFSTFSGYINRLRGYYGFSMKNTWYSYLPRKTALHEWPVIARHAYAFEWPDGWAGIDADAFPARDKF